MYLLGKDFRLRILPEEQSTMDTELKIQRIIVQHCRFCAEEKKADNLIDISNDKESLGLKTVIEYFKIDFIDFKNVDLPQTACVECYNKIIDSYTLFETIRESQITLFKLYCTKNENFTELSEDDVNLNYDLSKMAETVSVRSSQNSVVSNASNQDDKATGKQSSKEFDQKSSTEMDSKDIGNSNESFTNVENSYDESPKLITKSDNNYNNTLNSGDIPETSKSPANENKTTECEDKIDNNVDNMSCAWNTYRWCCNYCGTECDSMEDVRAHGLQLHKRCYAFKCVHCDDLIYPSFECFIEHVRQHEKELRFYCPHCNERFQTVVDCLEHTSTHVSDGKQICRVCGTIFPDGNALKLHKTVSRKVAVPKNLYKIPRIITSARNLRIKYGKNWEHVNLGTWDDYEWTCQECSLRCPSVQTLRKHTQDVHGRCFSMKCVDCPLETPYFRVFFNHVSRHRPHLSIYCPYCNKRMKDRDSIVKHIDEDHFARSQKPCDGCGQIFENKQLESQHYKQFNPIRLNRHLTTEDLTCDDCNKVFRNHSSFRNHKKTHEKYRKKEHVCDTCGKQSYSQSSLKTHILQCHGVGKTYFCKVCDKSFSTRRYLRAHVLTHLQREKKFICDHCGKQYSRKLYLSNHMIVNHIGFNKKYKCKVCFKTFISSTYLKNHMNIHDADRRYQCQNCEKTFTNWGNCNKHMMRIHKTTLAKTKRTPHGRIPIDKCEEVAQVNKQWMEDLVKN